MDALTRTGKKCYLRASNVMLADGETYTFRALPATRRTVPIMRVLLRDDVPTAEALEAMLSAVEISLSYDYTDEEVAELMDSGLVQPTNQEIIAAMVAGLNGGGADGNG